MEATFNQHQCLIIYKHFIDILISNKVSAISTSNLLNFVGDGLKILRHQLQKNKIDLPSWD